MRDGTDAPRAAATVLLLRDGRDGRDGIEVFMIRRAGKTGLLGGMHVFPGGKHENEDDALPSPLAPLDGAVARVRLGETIDGRFARGLHVAAARETLEEIGILLADGAAARAAEIRARQAAGEALGALLEEARLSLNLRALVPFARWVTPPIEAKRFDARFFLTRAPDDQEASPDGHEAAEGSFLNARAAVAAADAGEIGLLPPTLRSLQVLSTYETVAEALETAGSRMPPTIRPMPVASDEGFALAFPGDPEHSEKTPAFPGPTRLVWDGGRWR